MNKELILKSDVLDILFENRNKAYGAYALRKFYENRLLKSLSIMLTTVMVLSAFTFLPRKKHTGFRTEVYVMDETKINHVRPDEKKIEPVRQKIKQQNAPQKRLSNNIVIVNNKVKTDSLETLKPTDAIGKITVKDPIPGIVLPNILVIPAGGNEGTVKKTVDKSIPVYNPQIMPSYPGGMEALRVFLQRNLNNPSDIEAGDQVTVKIQFVVGFDGKLQGFETIEDGGAAFNKEVIRVLKKMPEWIPGKSNGENVAVYYTIPVKFVPSDQ